MGGGLTGDPPAGDEGSLASRSSTLPSLLLGFGVLALAVFRAVTSGFDVNDEAWMLQMLRRLDEGDRLYSEVWFSATPLSMYLALGVTAITGVQALALKLLGACIFTATVILALRIDRRLGGTTIGGLVLAAALLVYGQAPNTPPYTPLAMLFFLVAFAAAFELVRAEPPDGREARRLLLVGGLAAGLAFASKQNVGVLAAVGLGVAALLRSAPGGAARGIRDALIAAAAFLAVVAVALAPVLLAGSWGPFVANAFLEQDAYVRVQGLSLGSALAGFVETVASGDLRTAYLRSVALLPVAAVVALGVALVLGSDRRRAALVVVMVVGAVGAAYPRYDAVHLAMVAAPLLLGTAYALRLLASRSGRALRIAVAVPLLAWIALGFLARVGASARLVVSDAHGWSRVPELRGVVVDSARDTEVARAAAELEEGLPDGTFLLTTPASTWYLLADLENPTPYDYPIAGVLLESGQNHLIEEIRAGRIAGVCLGETEGNRAARLEAFVLGAMQPGDSFEACRLYERRSG